MLTARIIPISYRDSASSRFSPVYTIIFFSSLPITLQTGALEFLPQVVILIKFTVTDIADLNDRGFGLVWET